MTVHVDSDICQPMSVFYRMFAFPLGRFREDENADSDRLYR